MLVTAIQENLLRAIGRSAADLLPSETGTINKKQKTKVSGNGSKETWQMKKHLVMKVC